MTAARFWSEPHGVALQALSDGLLRQAHGDDRRGNVLLICHPGLAQSVAPYLQRGARSFGQAVALSRGRGYAQTAGGSRVECDSADLPFQDGVFRAVILLHLVSQGEEGELSEACRVLAADGVLLIVGLNRYGWQGLWPRWPATLPRIRPLCLRQRLEALGMRVEATWGAGLAGRQRPTAMRQGWSMLALPVADVLLIRVRQGNQGLFNRMRIRKTPAGVASAGHVVP